MKDLNFLLDEADLPKHHKKTDKYVRLLNISSTEIRQMNNSENKSIRYLSSGYCN